jgi:two-component system, NtrC family, nitrogen regulation sensor histidine kinase GlnL
MKDGGSRAFLYALLLVFNVFLWIMLVAFRWEVSLRTREVEYFERQLFPIGIHIVPLPVVFTACALMSAVSISVIVRDRFNLAARKRLQTLLEQILDSLDIGVVVLDRKGVLMLVNDSARKFLPQSMPVHSDRRFPDILKDNPQMEAVIRSALQEGVFTKEMEQKLDSLENSPTVRVSTLPLKNRQEKASGTLVLINDVSEEIAIQRQIRDAERLSTMGTLAATLAHEIRNPLEALNLNLELLKRIIRHIEIPPPEDGKMEKYVRVFDSEVSRLAGIVENFLSFARPSHTASDSIRLDVMLRQVLELIENQAQSRKVAMSLEIVHEPITIRGFEDRLKQLFLNLILNGIEAMPDGGILSIHAGTVRCGDSEPNASRAVVSIQDTGEGIPPEKVHQLFEPFFSTRTQGTGLGLTIAGRIAKEHGGAILVESVPGKGSKFTVELPVSV